ncbi:acyl-CoA dehydrogenase [Mycolicibacterium litorale]|uniref:Acyl-CoA dehydrogenase n=1 Tax=Mycolicibacterium litorale TaxID=758802 RepID=A0AAD1IS73_9MYCO|nr:acyl-CoA dehydrogenase [Mycolicibacterium litorale]MCV7417339.1 acyl-CoA dehydrogenase [Mycolicibacterium litorale]TDY05128.1 alkylation response protein AidB-like acyl-CoA dehydrogenase [Mycolicibacterium litorale]BBY18562.1 acyl-CoA dehydrogenase [Mycolicibacterium litorale]
MPIALTPEQTALSEAVREFGARHAPIDKTRQAFDDLAAGTAPHWWDELVANGFHAVHLPERVGGQGGDLVDTACVIEVAAEVLLPGPLLSTVSAGAVALLADTTPVGESLLGGLAAGAPAAVVLPDDAALQAVTVDGGWLVSGVSPVALGVCAARLVITAAHTEDGELLWFVADADGLATEPERGTDLTTDVGRVRFDGHHVTAERRLCGIDTDRARGAVAALTACAAAGTIRWCMGAVTEHLRTREQFGKPIGTFQALQHRAADLLISSELATAAAWDAVRSVDEPAEQHAIAAATGVLMAAVPAPDLVLDTLTMFGAIGFTWEHDLHLYWRRATALAASLGPGTRWKRRLGELTRTTARDMTVRLGDADPDFRTKIREILDRAVTLPNGGPRHQGDYEQFATGEQRTALAAAGLLAPHWPAPWGLDATPLQQLIIDEEFAARPELVRPSLGISEWILPSLISAAHPDVRDRLIPPTLRGELAWCQLFSEPSAGSDLAALTTRAVKVDGGWRINGHKIWTSSAQRADYGALLARTDPDARKHRGIGYFVVDMRADGVDVQPIRQASGDAEFNEVFLTDVFVPDEMLLGEPTAGWSLAIATMAQERVAIGNYVHNDRAGALRALAGTGGPDQDAALRALGEIDAYSGAIKALGVRETLRLLDGQQAGPASSIAKVATAAMLRRTFAATLELTGPAALLEDTEPPVVQPYLRLPAELVGGGTREIQLNIIAQMVLGLPRG